MSKRRILGGNNDLEFSSSTKLNDGKIEIQCPICNKSMSTLILLNKHIDTVHLEIPKPPITSTTYDTSIKSLKNNNADFKLVLPRDHFVNPNTVSKCADSRCTHNIGLKHGCINCAKCGKVYCDEHCKIKMKLNNQLKIENQNSRNGVWCKVCISCLNESPSWNDENNIEIIDKTIEFNQIRRSKIALNGLSNLIIERRLDKVYNWIISNITKINRINEAEFKNFENSIVDWQSNNDINNCPICYTKFGLFNRKHHCRICGNVICGDLKKGCSMVVPLGIIFQLMNVNKSKEIGIDYFEITKTLQNDKFGIRICFSCKKSVLNKKVYELDKLNLQDTEFIKCYKLWKLISNKIDNENLKSIKDDDENSMLVHLFTRLDKLIKHIDEISNNSNILNDELKMLKSLKLVIFNYIQLKLPILRKAQEEKLSRERKVLQNLIEDKPKLTKKEIREKREKLMVLNEQKFLVSNMYEDLKKQRRFDDLKTLDLNLSDIEKEINELTLELGDEAFSA